MATDLENIESLISRFKRPIPEVNNSKYKDRLVEEFELILNLRFTEYFHKICVIQ